MRSLVAFAGLSDWLGFEPADDLILEVLGPRADQIGPVDENLVVRAARSLSAHAPGLRLGRFRLIKRLPTAAGLGGGSADAAAALRLLADQAGLSVDDPRVRAAACATGADVLACLSPQAQIMKGIGDELGPAISCQTFSPFSSTPKFKRRRRRSSPPLTLRLDRSWSQPPGHFLRGYLIRLPSWIFFLCAATIWKPQRSG